MLNLFTRAVLALALFACAPAPVLADDEDIGAAIALVNAEMTKVYPTNTYRFRDDASLVYAYRVLFVGIADLMEQGYRIDGKVDTSGQPDALYAEAQTRLMHLSIDMGAYYPMSRGTLNTFPGETYLELLAHPPNNPPSTGAGTCPNVSAELAKIRSAVDAIEAKVR